MQKSKYYIIASIVSGIAMWLLAGAWHELVMAQFYTEEVGAKHEGTGVILIAYLILGYLMAYLYLLSYPGGKIWLEGLGFGMLMGILWVFPHELAMAGAHGTSILYTLKNGAWHLFEQGMGGVIIAYIFRKTVKIIT